jgi:hypothetical protein
MFRFVWMYVGINLKARFLFFQSANPNGNDADRYQLETIVVKKMYQGGCGRQRIRFALWRKCSFTSTSNPMQVGNWFVIGWRGST